MALPETDPPPVRRGVLAPIVAGLSALGSVWIIGLMCLICADITMRTLFNAPIAGVAEMVAFSIVGIVFLQLADTLRSGALTRSDLLLGFVGAALVALALWYFLPSLEQAWTRPERNFMGNPGFFQIPKWPLYALMSVGMVATVAQFLASALAAIQGRRA